MGWRKSVVDLVRASPLLGLAAACWSGLCVALELGGHAPSRPGLLPHWYGVQALLVWVLLPLQAVGLRWVAARVVDTSPQEAHGAVRGFSVALLCFLLTDVGALTVVGFAGLGQVLRVTGPLALLVGVTVGAVQLHAAGGSRGRSVVAMLLGFVAAGVLGGPFLR